MTLKEQCETRDFQLTTAPSNTFVVPNKANKFNFNKRGKCVVTSRFRCNFGYGFTTDDGMTWVQRIKFELDGSDWIIQNDCISRYTQLFNYPSLKNFEVDSWQLLNIL